MEIFLSTEINGNSLVLNEEESRHCVKVLRHKAGDNISVIDGEGRLYHCVLKDANPKQVMAEVIDVLDNWGTHPYFLRMAVCPTKNPDRYEWFLEKACEIGVDEIVPVIGEHSERKVFKPQRGERILVSAAKQSLKGRVPRIGEAVSVAEFIRDCGCEYGGGAGPDGVGSCSAARGEAGYGVTGCSTKGGAVGGIKLIACCFEDEAHPRISIVEALRRALAGTGAYQGVGAGIGATALANKPEITILIGPEGDFSEKELALALRYGFHPVHLGPSRLRTETAALYAVSAVYTLFL